VDREGVAVTTTEIEAWLAANRPGHDWIVHETLGIGLPMMDKVMYYHAVSGNDVGLAADYVLKICKGISIK
jgi:hypothetical protein